MFKVSYPYYDHAQIYAPTASCYCLYYLGASACMEVGLYEEAITWCNKGLAVSFHKHVLPH